MTVGILIQQTAKQPEGKLLWNQVGRPMALVTLVVKTLGCVASKLLPHSSISLAQASVQNAHIQN